MDTTIDRQVAMDEALVPHARRLSIGRSNFRLLSDICSKESTLQLVYDVLHLAPVFKVFLVIGDVLKIYMQEFWATAIVHHHSIRFKMDNNKHIVNLDSFRKILHICPRLPHQPFIEPPFEEEIRAFLRFLGHSGAIRRLSDGLYHKRNVDFAYLMWEDFVYQVEHKDTKKSNEMYYPRFTKVIIHHFMSKDPSIPRRNKVNWHYVRDDHMFTTIKLVSRHQNTQQFGALLPIELTNEDIRNSNAYKEYYAFATGATPPKPKASVRKTRSSFYTIVTPPTAAAGPRLSTSAKGKQPATTSKAKSLSALSKVAITKAQQMKLATKRSLQQTHISQASSSGADEGTKFNHPSSSTHAEEETKDEESFDPILKTPENTNDEGNGEENLGTNISREEGHDEKEEEDELYKDVNINLGRGIQLGDVHTTQEVEDSHVTLTPVNPNGQQQSSSVSSQFVTTPSALLQDLPNFGSLFGFDHRLNTLEANFSEFMQTNQFAKAVSSIPGIIQRYMDQQMNEVVKVAV
uniref:Retrovirus-related Pol polyprotein from transposon TNT 1-94 n=1 Tax=Tanacetum cinerariifolium TaxID=118510 RepID=A0A6L2LYA6_TANCI|nr:retrovirus-related Pol polyprotein from transposon TNT 1-94 [Tanacetum cinerariifolium]